MPATEWDILVVEDEFDSIQLLSKILLHHGANVRIARSGRECLVVLEEHIPHLILMDLALPDIDGWQALKKIRENPDTMAIPVVAMTAYHSVNVEDDVHHAGFDGYFPKPLDTAKIIDDIASIINA